MMRNSEIVSTEGRDVESLSSCTFSDMLLLSMPSRMKLFSSE